MTHQNMRIVASLMTALLPTASFALGLGQLHVISEPGAPLRAFIPVQHLSGKVPTDFALGDPGIQNKEIAHILDATSGWRLSLKREPTWHVLVAAPAPVNRPTKLLVDLHWSGGQLVREYMVPSTVSAVSSIQSDSSSITTSLTNQRLLPSSPHAPPLIAAATGQLADSGLSDDKTSSTPHLYHGWATQASYGVIQENSCLSGIAASLRGDSSVTINQIMMALVQVNPSAFIGDNPNRMIAGRDLVLPSMGQIRRNTPQMAFRWMQAASVAYEHIFTNKVQHKPYHHIKAAYHKSGHKLTVNHSVATRLVLSSAPKSIVQNRIKRLKSSDAALQDRINRLNSDMSGLQRQSAIDAQHIQGISASVFSSSHANRVITWAALSGNILLLLLFVWLFRRQNQIMSSYDGHAQDLL